MMKRSFSELDSAKDKSSRVQSLQELTKKLASCERMECEHCTDIGQYHRDCSRMTELHLAVQVGWCASHVMGWVVLPAGFSLHMPLLFPDGQ